MRIGFDDRGVPDGVQVRGALVEGDVDFVAAEVERFVVEGLVDVAGEVDYEFEGVLDLGLGEGGFLDAGSLE